MKYAAKLALFTALSIAVMGAEGAMAKGKKHSSASETTEAAPQAPHAGEKPLMVVRFNQTAVPYEWPLYNTLTKALEVRPQARFDVVSVAPRTTDLSAQAQTNDTASQDLTKVLATLKEIGMPEDRYSVSKIYDNVQSSEVRIYVR